MWVLASRYRKTIVTALKPGADDESSSTTKVDEYTIMRATYKIQQLAFRGLTVFERVREDFMTENLYKEGIPFGEARKKLESCEDTEAKKEAPAECLAILLQEMMKAMYKAVRLGC